MPERLSHKKRYDLSVILAHKRKRESLHQASIKLVERYSNYRMRGYGNLFLRSVSVFPYHEELIRLRNKSWTIKD